VLRDRPRCRNSVHQPVKPRLNSLDAGASSTLNRPMATSSDNLMDEIRSVIVNSMPPSCRGNPRIFGPGAPLDSRGLVNFLSDLEYRLAEKFNREIVLASERAMSRSRSPFRDVESLTEYVLELISE